MEDNPGIKSASPSSGSSPKRDDNILKRGTRVEITGNVRTKPEHLRKLGTVKSNNGLGGWHEIELDEPACQGKEKYVSLQRNALTVIGFDSYYASKHDDTVLTRKAKPTIDEEPQILPKARMRKQRLAKDDSSDEATPVNKRSFPRFTPPRKRLTHPAARAGAPRYFQVHYPVEQDRAAQAETLELFKKRLSPETMQRYVKHYNVPMSQEDTDPYEALARHWKALPAPDPYELLSDLCRRVKRPRMAHPVPSYALYGKVFQ
eukprot:jgi/Botrbrau1/21036/Bobra.0144s0047.1